MSKAAARRKHVEILETIRRHTQSFPFGTIDVKKVVGLHWKGAKAVQPLISSLTPAKNIAPVEVCIANEEWKTVKLVVFKPPLPATKWTKAYSGASYYVNLKSAA